MASKREQAEARRELFKALYEERYAALRAENRFVGPVLMKIVSVSQAHQMALEYAKAVVGTAEGLLQCRE